MTLLHDSDPKPVIARDFGADPRFLLVCDHAGRAIPRMLGDLGLNEAELETHIAWDIGALGVAERMAEALGARLIAQAYSRLVIDCNRDPTSPGAVLARSDGVDIPGNSGLAQASIDARVSEVHAPYHAAIAREIDARMAAGQRPLLVCVHSFTPNLADGAPRPWHVGVLHGPRSPVSEALLDRLRSRGEFEVGDNEPYAMDGNDYTGPVHAWARGLDLLELEIRQDLIATPEGQGRFAKLFADLLPSLPSA